MLNYKCSNGYINVQLALKQAADRLKPWNGDLSETGEKNESSIQRTKICPKQSSCQEAACRAYL